ncbi:MAG: hypothetical protein ACSW8H_08310, partial [bacterium]
MADTKLHLSWINLYDLFTSTERKAAGINSQKKFAANILPNSLKNALFHGESPESMGSTLSRVFNHKEGVSDRPFNRFLDKFMEAGASTGETITSENHPLLRAVRTSWHDILRKINGVSPESPERVRQNIRELMNTQFPKDDTADILRRLRTSLDKCKRREETESSEELSRRLGSLAGVLASLTVIASTLPAWNAPDENKNKKLFDLVLGAPPEAGDGQTHSFLMAENNKTARELLAKAQALFDRPGRTAKDCQEIYGLYIRISNMEPAVDYSLCLDAQFLCKQLQEAGDLDLRKEHKIDEFLKRSSTYGIKLSAKEQDPRLTFSFHRPKQPAISEFSGFC